MAMNEFSAVSNPGQDLITLKFQILMRAKRKMC